jgi:hypothetical protein
MDLSISVSAKWVPAKTTKFETLKKGWICRSNNPEVETDRFDSYIEAFDAFMLNLKRNWIETWDNYPYIEVSPPVVRGKADRFSVDALGEFTLSLYEDEVSVSWLVTFSKPLNRTLGEFEPVRASDVDAVPVEE